MQAMPQNLWTSQNFLTACYQEVMACRPLNECPEGLTMHSIRRSGCEGIANNQELEASNKS